MSLQKLILVCVHLCVDLWFQQNIMMYLYMVFSKFMSKQLMCSSGS